MTPADLVKIIKLCMSADDGFPSPYALSEARTLWPEVDWRTAYDEATRDMTWFFADTDSRYRKELGISDDAR